MGQIGDFEFILSLEDNDEDDFVCADDVDDGGKYGNGDDGNDGGDDGKTLLVMTMTMMMTRMTATMMMTMMMMMITIAEISNVLELQTKFPGRLWFPTT